MILNWVCSIIKGLWLSGSVYVLGKILDEYVSGETKQLIIKENSKLISDAETAVQVNLLIISPFIYGAVDQWYLVHQFAFSWLDFAGLIIMQNLGYFFIHREMHRNKKLFWIHQFHHQYDRLLIPSLGNAVSIFEFGIAYVVPIVLGAALLRPTEITYMSSIGLISVLNLIIHTQELGNVWWIPGLVSPKSHIAHHELRDKHYAAPLLDVDGLLDVWELVEK